MPVSIDDEAHAATADEGLLADRPIEYHGRRDEERKYHDMGCIVTPHSGYVGQFSHNVKHGRGMLVNESGPYIGEFNLGEQQGRGVLVDKKGCRWVAQFKAGRPCGRCIVGHLGGSSEFAGDLSGCRRRGYFHKGFGIGTKPRECCLGKWINSAFFKGKRSLRLEMVAE